MPTDEFVIVAARSSSDTRRARGSTPLPGGVPYTVTNIYGSQGPARLLDTMHSR